MRRRGESASGTATSHRSRTRASIREKYSPASLSAITPMRAKVPEARRTGTAQANPFGAISDPKWISTSPGRSAGNSSCADCRNVDGMPRPSRFWNA